MISPMRPPRTPLGLMMTKVVCMWISGSKVQKRVTNLTLPAFFVLNPFNESRRLRYIFPPRGHSSVGRASASHADGRRFESDCPLHFLSLLPSLSEASKRRPFRPVFQEEGGGRIVGLGA